MYQVESDERGSTRKDGGRGGGVGPRIVSTTNNIVRGQQHQRQEHQVVKLATPPEQELTSYKPREGSSTICATQLCAHGLHGGGVSVKHFSVRVVLLIVSGSWKLVLCQLAAIRRVIIPRSKPYHPRVPANQVRSMSKREERSFCDTGVRCQLSRIAAIRRMEEA